jgi:hypothetical protein
MTYIVDAWLEQPQPRLRVTDRRSGRVLIDWGAERVRGLLERGDLVAADFCLGPARLQDTVRELFLLSCCRCDDSGLPAVPRQ